MAIEKNPAAEKESPAMKDISSLAVRVIWFFAGPAVLVLVLIGIMQSGSGWLTGFEVAYFLMLGLMIACRAIEQRSGHGLTAYGEPSTWADFRRYVLVLVPLAVVAWVAANVLGNHVF